MATFPHWLCHLQPLAGTLLTPLVDAFRYVGLCRRSPAVLAAKNLFLLGDMLAATDTPERETLTAAVLEMRR
jgi:hypothetical protein